MSSSLLHLHLHLPLSLPHLPHLACIQVFCGTSGAEASRVLVGARAPTQRGKRTQLSWPCQSLCRWQRARRWPTTAQPPPALGRSTCWPCGEAGATSWSSSPPPLSRCSPCFEVNPTRPAVADPDTIAFNANRACRGESGQPGAHPRHRRRGAPSPCRSYRDLWRQEEEGRPACHHAQRVCHPVFLPPPAILRRAVKQVGLRCGFQTCAFSPRARGWGSWPGHGDGHGRFRAG